MSPGSEKPLPYKPRMLVLCFDGTANEYDGENTNVVKFFAMLRKDCDDEQLCYYQTGVGTYLPPGIWSTVAMRIAKVLDEAVAWYLDAHVMDGYEFIMNNYRPGDKISIFGFSRGAYTARALAGFLTKIGLLPRDNEEQVTFAYKMYKRTGRDGIALAAGFKETFCRPVQIEFLGVWDTVASTGILMSRNLPFTTNNSLIKTFRHALALDERRAKFVPTFWQLSKAQPRPSKPAQGATPALDEDSPERDEKRVSESSPDACKDSNEAQQAQAQKENAAVKDNKSDPWMRLRRFKQWRTSNVKEGSTADSDLETTDVKQVWFVGGHGDVGGGAEKNSIQSTLSDIPLRWMVREVVASHCDIQFESTVMEKLNVHVSLPTADYYLVGSSSASASDARPSEKDCEADKIDATKPLHDQLRWMPLWWILEVLPLPFTWQDASGKWHKKWELHLGKGRYVNQTGPLLFHETVRIRMTDKSLQYRPAAKYTEGKESYVW